MKERPILFKGEMVRAILEGRKTQTRRAVKTTAAGMVDGLRGWPNWHPHEHGVVQACPYGQPGDRLWIREMFSGARPVLHQNIPPRNWSKFTNIWYWADGNPDEGDWTKPKPSIHMPRWASRITLEITNISVERLNYINNTDILREGIRSGSCNVCVHTGGSGCEHCFSILNPFRVLWESINGKTPGKAWADNPWVWVVGFKVVKS